MAAIQDFDELHHAASAHFPGRVIQLEGDRSPTLHLYHAPNSICSQKVRAVLLATGQTFVSHELDIFKGETYEPNYVRLRLMGCLASGLPLAFDHLGTTSAAATGCDACVVPTIAVTDSREVIVDSKNICLELDRRNPTSPNLLTPGDLKDEIEAEISIVDNLPNYQLLAASVGASAANNGFALSKVNRCNTLMAANIGDKALSSAYAAKRAKEQAGADRLFDAAAMGRARDSMERSLRELDGRLSKRGGPYLFGALPTMADLFWGVELIRIDDLGMSSLWSEGGSSNRKLAALGAYYTRISQFPAVLGAVTQWPGARLKMKSALPN